MLLGQRYNPTVSLRAPQFWAFSPNRRPGTPRFPPMKLHLANTAGLNIFTAYGDGYVAINTQRHEGNLIVLPQSLFTGWTTATPASLTEADMAKLLALGTEIVLLGTGRQLRFPPGALLRPFAPAGIGLEVMDLQAACRTYNILAAEGRKVAAALVFD